MANTIRERLWELGLRYIPEYEDMSQQYILKDWKKIANKTAPKDYFSLKNRQLLYSCMINLDLDIGGGTILEIGIGKKDRFETTSTKVILDTKNYHTKYIGIDEEKREWLLNKGSNIFVYNDLSENVLKKFNNVSGAYPTTQKRYNLLHIDGDHSVNAVLIDWEFTEFVKDFGIILLHDIKAHLGPKLLVDAIDRDVYTVHKMFLDDPKDFGMAVVYKKENDYGKIFA